VDVPGVGPAVLGEILRTRRHGAPPEVEQALDADGLRALFQAVDEVFLPEPVADYVARLTSATHPRDSTCPDDARRYLRYGASPRGAIAMAEAARAAALLAGRPNVDFADVERVAPAALRHRLVLDHAARIEGVGADEIVARVLAGVDVVGHPLPRDVV
jgi:MoxR-like ATPase